MIISEFTGFWKDFDRYFGRRHLVDKCRIFLDCWREYRRSLTPCPMYGQLRFDRLSRAERAKYVTLGRLLEFARRANDPEKAEIFFNKGSFHRLFADFTGRSILDLRTADREAVAVFAKKAQSVFVKPRRGTCGVGCSLVDCSTDEAIAALWAKCGGTDGLVEEVIVQHGDLAALNPHGVNPIRIVTFLGPAGTVRFPCGCATIRIGVDDSPVVNFARGALEAAVDLETGRIFTAATDAFGGFYERHPVSGAPIVGQVIPCGRELADFAAKLARVVPEVPFVGWDLTVGADGHLVVIEGNPIPDITNEQKLLGRGLQPVLDALMCVCKVGSLA